jgi:DNA helicase-2/ATP-dependent DNA helicase PcrA
MGARPSSFKVEVKPKDTREWSAQQQDIFNWFEYEPLSRKHEQPEGAAPMHLVVRARAGTGKTTTIIEGVNRAPESSILLCAFNKKIAEELNSRIDNPNAEAKTLHALGFAAIRRNWRGMPVAQQTARQDFLTDKVCGMQVPRQIGRLVSLLHTKARDMMPILPTIEGLRDLALFFDYAPDDDWSATPRQPYPGEPAREKFSKLLCYDLDYVVGRAYAAMEYAANNEPTYDVGIDFADMIYLPLAYNLLAPDYDMVVVDEAQDLTLAQLTIAQRVCRGRICVVGDDKQAIYAFRGADTRSLDRLKRELGAAELPLTVTYRCCQAVVRQAQGLVPDIVAHSSNPEGVVDDTKYEQMLQSAVAGNFILSRLNAPLVSTTLKLLRSQKRARMAGRDIGAGIGAVIKKVGGRSNTLIEDLLSKLHTWESKQVTKFASYNQLQLIERTRDQADMIRALAEDSEDVQDLLNRIDWLFTDDDEAEQILCSSVHKAKGLEADRVYILSDTLYLRGPSVEEDNIFYVATTRAKSHLTMVSGVK